MLKIAICDDEKYYTTELISSIENYGKSNGLSFECDVFLSGEELLEADISQYAILFLDVEMERVNGIETARILRTKNQEFILVYVSGVLKYAPMGYNVNAFRYVLKDDLKSSFKSVMDDTMEKLQMEREMFVVRLGNEKKEIRVRDIVYIESFKRKLVVHTTNCENEQYECYARLNELTKELETKHFIQIHKSYLVNMQHIASLKGHTAYLKNGEVLKASDRNWQDILTKYAKMRGEI